MDERKQGRWRGSSSGGGGVQIVSAQPHASCKGRVIGVSTAKAAN